MAKKLSFGQNAADFVNKWVGSWGFVIGILVFIILWMALNTVFVVFGVWDKYPFIVLNLVLSSVAALHASIILMSQNRRSEIDAERIQHDYLIDKKAEKEIKQVQLDILEIKQVLLKKENSKRMDALKKDLDSIQSDLNRMEQNMQKK